LIAGGWRFDGGVFGFGHGGIVPLWDLMRRVVAWLFR
jgi:hypothetical protein